MLSEQLLQSLPLPGPAIAALGVAAGARAIDALYSEVCGSQAFVEDVLRRLDIGYRVAHRDLTHIPTSGSAVVTSNHPYGLLESAVLAVLLRRVRPDVRFVANDALRAVPELADLIIPVDVFGSRGRVAAARRAIEHLESGGLLVIFPAGAVSRFSLRERSVIDPEWSTGIARMIRLAAARVKQLRIVPAYVCGNNSTLFQFAGLLHPLLQTLLLGREFLNKTGRDIEVRFGSSVTVERLAAIPSEAEQVEYLRWRTYLLRNRATHKARTRATVQRPRQTVQEQVAEAHAPEQLEAELHKLTPLVTSGDLAAYLARAAEIPLLLDEIGRTREITFRAAGEGTGKPRDLDDFDQHYWHLFLWDRNRRQIAGGYRLAEAARVADLYTATLFRYSQPFLDKLGPSCELGRSFVCPEYQKGFAPLLLLWKGIGRFIADRPRLKTLFGAVSISNDYQPASRRMIVSYLERRELLSEMGKLVRARNPFRAADSLPESVGLEDVAAAIEDMEPSRAGVPVLLRQYLRLGGKLLAFSVDRAFSNALDGLIAVDLTKTDRTLLERYLGKDEAARFLNYHGSTCK